MGVRMGDTPFGVYERAMEGLYDEKSRAFAEVE